MKERLHYLLFLFILFSYTTVAAQNEYVILNTGDTVTGKIDIYRPSAYSEEIMVKTPAKRKLNTSEFRSFVKNGEQFRSVFFNGRYRIMKVLYAGSKVSAFAFRSENSYEFDTEILYRNNNEATELSALGYKKTVTRFLNDCPGIAEADEKLFKRNNLVQLVQYYHECIGNVAATPATPAQQSSAVPQPVQTVPATPAEPSTPVVKPSALALIEALAVLKGKVSGMSNNELPGLVNDMLQKAKGGEKIPSYMVNALKDQTAGMDGLREEVAEVLKHL